MQACRKIYWETFGLEDWPWMHEKGRDECTKKEETTATKTVQEQVFLSEVMELKKKKKPKIEKPGEEKR